MKCPKCGTQLSKQTYRGMEVERCDSCKGTWLDFEELDRLEDVSFDADNLKGSLMLSSEPTNYQCPHCSRQLRQFEYRMNNLRLEYCENRHGFWLDKKEEERVLQLMKDREGDMKRKFEAEVEWENTLRRFRSKSFWNKLTDLFR